MSRTLALDFPLCAKPDRTDAVRPVVEASVAFLLEEAGLEFEAVILMGSLARGEGSVLLRGGATRLLSDVELLTIVRVPFDWPAARRRLVGLGRRMTARLRDQGVVASVEFMPAGMSYLRQSIRPCIFAYDLCRHGKVVYGRPDILDEVRPFGVEAIPREDALSLVMNRMVELLILREAPPDPSPDPGDALEAPYQAVKTTLDLAGSALAFAGQHVSRYADRHEAFRALLESSPELRTALPDGAGFLVELGRAIELKLIPSEELLAERLVAEWVAAVSGWARGVWLWEIRRLLGRDSGTLVELVEGYLRAEPLEERLRGWAKFWRHPLRPPGSVSIARGARLFLKASPHRLTYAAACLACWAGPADAADWSRRAGAWLPVRTAAGTAPSVGDVTHLWRWLIRND